MSSLYKVLSKTTKLLISILIEHDVFVCSVIDDLNMLTGKLVRGDIYACWETRHLKEFFIEPI